MYIAANIDTFGTEAEHLTAVKNFFINNSIAQWQLVNDNLSNTSGTANSLVLSLGSCRINITSKNLNDSDYENGYNISFSLAGGNYTGTTAAVASRNNDFSTRTDTVQRNVKILIAETNGTLMVNISGFPNAMGYTYNKPFFLKTTLGNTEVACVDSINDNVLTRQFHKVSDGSGIYTVSPLHDNATVDDKLIFDTKLLAKDGSGRYIADPLSNCCSLGGGEHSKFYIDSNNELLYCFADNCCIKPGISA